MEAVPGTVGTAHVRTFRLWQLQWSPRQRAEGKGALICLTCSNHWTIVLARKKVLDTLIEGLLEDLLDDLWKYLREDLQILPDGFCSTLSLRAYQRDVTVWLSTIRAPRRIVQLHLVHTWSTPPWKRTWKRTWKHTWPHCLGRAAGSAGYRETAKRHDISRMCLAFWEVRTCTFLRLKQFGTTRLLAFLI